MTKTKPESSSLSAWQARGEHTITCPSGQRLKIRIPGIGTLLEKGDLPEDLLDLALLELTSDGGAAGALAAEFSSGNGDKTKALERIRQFGEFQRHLVSFAVKAVETAPNEWEAVTLTPESMTDGSLPEDDLALVAEIVQRLRAHDAKGVRIGVEPLDRWAMFREAHACKDDCEGCQNVASAFSSI